MVAFRGGAVACCSCFAQFCFTDTNVTASVHFDIEFFTETLKKTKNILHIDQLNGTSGFNFSIAIYLPESNAAG